MKLINTDRLFLREMTPDDYQALFQVLGDPETMWHYPYSFDGQHVRDAWDTVRIDDYLEIEAMTTLSGNHPKYIGWVPVERVLKTKEYD